jgi:alpha-galactosidase
MKQTVRIILLGITSSVLLISGGCSQKEPSSTPPTSVVKVSVAADQITLTTSAAEFTLLPSGYLKASLLVGGKALSLDQPSNAASEVVTVAGKEVSDFQPDLANAKLSTATGKLGKLGQHVEVTARSASTGLERTLAIEVYDDFPQMAVTSSTYRNNGSTDQKLESVTTQKHRLDAQNADSSVKPTDMWSFEGASIDWGKDEILPMPAAFQQDNIMGAPVNEGHGGGIPVNAFWTRSVGEAIGHLETIPLVLLMPVSASANRGVETKVELKDPGTLVPGASYSIPRTFVAVYQGDFYEPLHMYSQALQREGWSLPKPNQEDFGVAWCGWGYEFNVTPTQMTDTIPKLKELGIHWATLDDRWFDTYGDWHPRKDTFPGDSIKKMVDTFHSQGIKVQLWWYPLVAEDDSGRYESHKYVVADVVKQHPDWLILNKDGKPAHSERGLATMCPALPEVRAYMKSLTEHFIKDWDFDGYKLDNIYSVPACYNPEHHHKSANDSIAAMGDVYREIFQTTRALKADSVTQICPCGTTPSIAWLPYMDQAVTADPVGGVQVRRRIKMYKALLGPEAAVYGDHVELSEMKKLGKDQWLEYGRDFASTLGTGGVLGTKFTWADNNPKFKNVALTTDKEAQWKKWISLYNDKELSRGEFRDLYVYGYDKPEAYAIEKGGVMYYAFFTPDPNLGYTGPVELRGLRPGKYRVVDYVNQKELGTIDSTNPRLDASFTGHLLVQSVKE